MQPWPSVGHVYSRVAARHGIQSEADRVTRQFVNAWKQRGEFDYSRQGWLDLVRQSFDGMAEVTEELFIALYDSFSTHDAWKIFDDVLPTLEELQKRGVRLAVISNWDERLRPTLRAVGLHDYFEVITVSGEHSINKPARELFDLTAKALNLPAAQILHIGDSPREDVWGAQNAGFRALHLDRDTPSLGSVPSLAELLASLGTPCHP
jgi:putative hydrolase of the HAD superfamily